eukprot:3054362-Pleurochrysis_carterae.AAC.2
MVDVRNGKDTLRGACVVPHLQTMRDSCLFCQRGVHRSCVLYIWMMHASFHMDCMLVRKPTASQVNLDDASNLSNGHCSILCKKRVEN